VDVNIYYVDGEFLPESEAKIPIDDLSILRAYGIFDYMRTYSGKPVFLKHHLARLRNSADQIGLELPWSSEELTKIVWQTLDRNSNTESNIRIVVTGGSSPDFITPQNNPRLLVLVNSLRAFPEAWTKDGVKIITMNFVRNIPGAKSIDYIQAIRAQKKAREQGAVEVAYVDRQNQVLEGTISNLFAFFGDILVTPGDGILNGITRKTVLNLADGKFDIEIRNIDLDELLSADEVIITGSNRGILPVVQINDRQIGDGKPGDRARLIMDAFIKHTAKLANSM
jgi:branched-chain amino acid aminotransferase